MAIGNTDIRKALTDGSAGMEVSRIVSEIVD